MAIPKRISVKFFAKNPEVVEAEQFIPTFQRWIQRKAVEGSLIDVAHYLHVEDGPGVLLISHEGDYAYDFFDGRAGLSYVRKTPAGDTLAESVRNVLRIALAAADKLEGDKKLNGLRFDTSEIKIAFIDRLNTPNTPEAFNEIGGPLGVVLGDLYGGAVTLERAHDDPREALAFRVKADAVSVKDLLGRLAVAVA